jgi:hypothetical protein
MGGEPLLLHRLMLVPGHVLAAFDLPGRQTRDIEGLWKPEP